jgi:Protein of unknown function (DUF2800)
MAAAYPQKKPGPAALKGTLMHSVFERVLNSIQKKRGHAAAYIGLVSEKRQDVVFDEEMAELVQGAVNWVGDYRFKHTHTEMWTELELPVGEALDKKLKKYSYGTADAVIYSKFELVVLDLKGGFIYVDVAENEQLLLYALGAVLEMSRNGRRVDRLRLVIAQPRHGVPRELVLDVPDLEAHRKFFAARAWEALEANAPLHGSETACKWCPAAGNCAEAHKVSLELAKKVDWPETQAKDTLTESQFRLLLEKASFVRKMLDRAEEMAMDRLMNGEQVKGFKLVASRKYRQWKDEKTAALWLAEAGISPTKASMITPAAAEKELAKTGDGEELPDELWEIPPGDPRLAPATDSRPELKLDSGLKKQLNASLKLTKGASHA